MNALLTLLENLNDFISFPFLVALEKQNANIPSSLWEGLHRKPFLPLRREKLTRFLVAK